MEMARMRHEQVSASTLSSRSRVAARRRCDWHSDEVKAATMRLEIRNCEPKQSREALSASRSCNNSHWLDAITCNVHGPGTRLAKARSRALWRTYPVVLLPWLASLFNVDGLMIKLKPPFFLLRIGNVALVSLAARLICFNQGRRLKSADELKKHRAGASVDRSRVLRYFLTS